MDGYDEEESNETKTFTWMSPSSKIICLLCQEENFDKSKVRNLWEQNKKLNICLEIEECLSVEISKSTNFNNVCRNCLLKTQNLLKKLRILKTGFENGKVIAEKQFTRTRVKRLSDEHCITAKKKLFNLDSMEKKIERSKPLCFDNVPKNFDQIKIKISTDRYSSEITTTGRIQFKLLQAICSEDTSRTMAILSKHYKEEFFKEAKNMILSTVQEEASYICSDKRNPNSTFRLKNCDEMLSHSFTGQKTELEKNCPIILDIVNRIALNVSSLARNKKKKEETLLPPIMNAISILFLCRNHFMNKCAALNSMVLRKARADKSCFDRFQSLGIASSYTNVMEKQEDLGVNFRTPVENWISDIENNLKNLCEKYNIEKEVDKEIGIEIDERDDMAKRDILDTSAFDKFAKQPIFKEISHSSFNEIIETSHCDMEEGSEFEYEILTNEFLRNETPVFSEVGNFLNSTLNQSSIDQCLNPTTDDETTSSECSFRNKFMIVGDNLDIKIKRRHMTKNKQNIDYHLYNFIAVKNRIQIPNELIGIKAAHPKPKNIRIADFIPSITDEQNITNLFKYLIAKDLVKYKEELKWMDEITPKHFVHEYWEETSKVSEIVSLGIIEENENSNAGITQIMKEQQTLVPQKENHCLRTFAIGDLLTVERSQNAQKTCQDSTTSSKRLDGLIPALADFHTYGNFLEVVFHLLYNTKSSADIGTLYQARNFLNARNVPTDPMKNINACEELILKYTEALLLTAYEQMVTEKNINTEGRSNSIESRANYNEILGTIIDDYVHIATSDKITTKDFECPYCKLRYKRSISLKNHVREKHNRGRDFLATTDTIDAKFNYSKNALAMGYLIKAIIYCRKTGNGKLTIMLHKYLLLYFKLDHRTKYSFQTLHLLAQINYLLPPALAHELTWNRTVNNTGKPDGNVELDRELEHRNKYAKADLKNFHGKVTEKSIKRCGRSYDKMRKIMNNLDDVAFVNARSGKHTKPEWVDDVKELADQYRQQSLFKNIPGRFHSTFPAFPQNYLQKLDMLTFKNWCQESFKKFHRMNIFNNRDIFTFECN